jgi:hypothetical protein
MEKKVLAVIAASIIILAPFGASAQESQDLTIQQQGDLAQESTLTTEKNRRQKILIGLNFGNSYRLKTGKKNYTGGINIDYLFSPHFGISSAISIFDGGSGGYFIGPMFSTAIDRKERFEFDVKPKIGYGSGDDEENHIFFDIGASLRLNLGNHFSLSGNFDLYPGIIEWPDEKSPVIAFSLGAAYRFNPAKRKDAHDEPEWIYRSKTNRFGIKAGYNQANTISGTIEVDGNTIEIYGSGRSAFHVGLFDNYSFTNRIGLQVEGLFSVQGNENNKLSYINVPVLLDWRVARTFSILAGPQIGLNVSNPDSYKERLSFVEIQTLDAQTSPVDFGFAFGPQFTIAKHLVAGARINLGLTPVRTFKGATNVSGYTNSVLQLSAGWLF